MFALLGLQRETSTLIWAKVAATKSALSFDPLTKETVPGRRCCEEVLCNDDALKYLFLFFVTIHVVNMSVGKSGIPL